ncbi:MAG: hypothetical protein OEV64_02980 [Desulfobulbaceae bacterium]|nr:hypothetical protein [Desulfobulbaceae bacterium]
MSNTTQKLRLPKLIEADPRSTTLLHEMEKRGVALWPESTIKVPEAHPDLHLTATLKDIYVKGQIVRGLEGAERTLAAEEKGLRIADKKTEQTRGVRISRLLLLTDDGSERFYRQVEKLLLQHGPRVLAVRLTINAEGFGEMLYGPENIARLIMLEHKTGVGSVLLSLADQWIK